MVKNILILGLSVLMLSACELKNALKSVNEMPEKIDHTNEQIIKTNEQVTETNGEIKKTNSAVHKQALQVAIDEMQKPENQEKLFPVPSAMMPFGKAFAEEAHEDELLDYIYLKVKEIQEVNPSNGTDANGNDIPLTADQLNRLRINKLGTLYSLFIISGFIPDQMLSNIVQHQILEGGRYYETALNILMMRVIFLRDLMLDSDLLEKPLVNSGMMNEAVKNLSKIEYVLELPFSSQVHLQVTDGVNHLVEVKDSLTDEGSLAATRAEWKKAYNNALDGAHAFQKQSLTGDAQKDETLYRQEMAAQSQALNTMKKYADKWSASNLQ